MLFLGRFFATIFAFVFVVASVLALLLFNMNATLASPGAYKAVLVQKKVYERLPTIGAKFIVDDMFHDASKLGADSAAADLAEMTSALAATLPAAVLQTTGETMIDRVFAFIDGKAATVSAPLAGIRTAVASGAPAAFHKVLDSKPDCTANQLKAFELPMALHCKPPPKMAAADTLGKSITDMVGDLPDEYPLISAAAAAEAGMQQNLKMVRVARTAMVLSPLAPLLALLLIAAATVRSKPSAMRWTGWPLLIAGLVGAAVIAVIGQILAKTLAQRLSPEALPSLPPEARVIAVDLSGGLSQAFTRTVMVEAVLMGLIGVALIVAAGRLKTKTTGVSA